MTLAGLLVFAAAYALAVASPGPGIAAVVGQVLGRGIRTAPSLIAGILTGDLIWFTCAALGLAALAQAYAGIFLAIKWVGVAYLVFLAWKMWTSPVDALQASADRKDISHGQLFISGLSLTLGNPKAIAFFMALLPAIVDLAQLSEEDFKQHFAGTPLLRTKRRGLLRNVAVALGNWGTVEAREVLQKLANDPDPLIEEHAAWGLSQPSASTE